jgi:hypothetical protein
MMFLTWQFWLAAAILAIPLAALLKTIAAAILIATHIGVVRWQESFGIHIIDYGSGRICFIPCSKGARQVLRKHAKEIKGAAPMVFSSYVVPRQSKMDLYEACSHDAEHPQCMVMAVDFGGRAINLVEA